MIRTKGPKCQCGCEQTVNWNKHEKRWNKFVAGHNFRLEIPPESEAKRREKIKNTMNKLVEKYPNEFRNRESFKGKTHTPEARAKMSQKAKEREKKKVEMGFEVSDETKQKISKTHKGRSFSEQTKRKISKAKKGKTTISQEQRKQISGTLQNHFQHNENPFKGKTHSEETRQILSEANTGRFRGENGPNWQGGISSFPYGIEWNPWLRQEIKERDNHSCRFCEKKDKLLDVHHIDFDKNNNSHNNLITLCKHHHGKANRGYISQEQLINSIPRSQKYA